MRSRKKEQTQLRKKASKKIKKADEELHRRES